MYPNSVPAIISKNVGNALTNYKTWGGILYNVKVYGALGDGATDDTAAIQATLNAVSAAGGGIVYLPPGIYKTSALSIPSSNIILKGSGMGITTLRFTGNNVTLTGIVAVSLSNVGVEQLSINLVTPSTVDAFQVGIRYKDCTDCYMNNVEITGQWNSHGLRMEGCTRGNIIECIADTVTSPLATGSTRKAISVGSSSTPVRSSEIKIINCTVKNCVGGNVVDAIGVADSDNVTISQNLCYNNDYGINAQNATGMVVTDNQCHTNTQIGIDLSNGCTNSIVDGNTCYSNGNDGIRHWGNTTQGAERTILSNNVCYNNGVTDALSAGIRLSDQAASFPSKNNIVTGNLCYDTRTDPSRTQDYGILETANSAFSLIKDNHCFNNKTANESTISKANGYPVMDMGTSSVAPVAGVSQSVTITFKVPFAAGTIPRIIPSVAGLDNVDSVQLLNVQSRNVTNTGASLVVGTTDATNIDTKFSSGTSDTMMVTWIAFGAVS